MEKHDDNLKKLIKPYKDKKKETFQILDESGCLIPIIVLGLSTLITWIISGFHPGGAIAGFVIGWALIGFFSYGS
jgi:hypothetical protein